MIVGSAMREGMTPKTMNNTKGFVRGFDVRTGKQLWIFHTIPAKGEFGYDTWLNGSADYTGNTGVWTQISVDEELGLVYLPVESPTGDYYGGHRPGNDLFGESLVCVDLKTGQRKWHYQLVHHPLWDMDISSAPLLVDINVNGKPIKAVAQPTKQGFLYVFDRVTGKPVWPIEEKPVEKGNVPGEWYSPTQPFPTKPPAYARNGITPDDLIDFTPALHEEALTISRSTNLGPVFTPPSAEQRGRSAGHADPRHRQRRNQLAGRLVRSRDAHRLRLRVQRLPDADRPGAAPTRRSRTCATWRGRPDRQFTHRPRPRENAGADSPMPSADCRRPAVAAGGGG